MAHEADVLRNLVLLNRVANGMAKDARDRLRGLFDELAAVLLKHDPTSVQERYRRARVEKIMAEAESLLGEGFEQVRKQVRSDLARLAVQQTTAATSLLETATSVALDIQRGEMSLNLAKTIIDRDPFEGLTLAEWAEGQSVRTVQQVRRQVQLGMLNNEDIGSIVRRVRGKSNGRGGFVGGVLESTTREAEMVVRTAVNWISNDAQMRAYRANADVLEAVEWSATLDARTCFAAGTGVLTPGGWRPIEELRAGDLVVGGSRTPRVVRGTTQRTTPRLARVTLSNGEVVICTPDHRFLTAENEWVEAQMLSPGQQLAETAKCRPA